MVIKPDMALLPLPAIRFEILKNHFLPHSYGIPIAFGIREIAPKEDNNNVP
jgi:hypothetical protein